jgi:hypothetical protein
MDQPAATTSARRLNGPGDIARTRGVLMALSRERDWYFAKPVARSLVAGVLSLGLLPLLDHARRLDRWRRLEWTQYAEAARWIGHRTGDATLTLLASVADRSAGAPSGRWTARICAAGALVVLAASVLTGDPWAMLWTAFVPLQGGLPAVLFSGLLGFGWVAHFNDLRAHAGRVERWLEQVNVAMVAHDRRPIVRAESRTPTGWMIAGVLLGVAGPLWLGVQTMVLALQNRYIRSTQSARWQMCERVLEWMDESGLPMEYDIEKLEPEQIAAMFS